MCNLHRFCDLEKYVSHIIAWPIQLATGVNQHLGGSPFFCMKSNRNVKDQLNSILETSNNLTLNL